MLNKAQIIEGLKNNDKLVRDAIYEYVSRLHLYDDKEINSAYIMYIKENYPEINLSEIQYSRANKDIIECLLEIYIKEKDVGLLEYMSGLFLKHYNIIKELDFDLDKLIVGEDNILLYKKIQHFAGKDPERLIELYKSNMIKTRREKDLDYVTQVINLAIQTALLQTEQGCNELNKHVEELKANYEEELYHIYIASIIHVLCEMNRKEYSVDILKTYLRYEYLCTIIDINYYFSDVCDDKFVDSYIKCLKSVGRENVQFYHHDIASYLNSDKIDVFLLSELKKTKDDYVKVGIMEVLANRFNKEVIPYALEHLKENEDRDLKEEIYPLLVLYGIDDKISERIKEEVRNPNILDNISEEMMVDLMHNLQQFLLKDKEHIKKYKKIRKLHNSIVENMMKGYFDDFENRKNILENIVPAEVKLDFSTELGMQAIANMVVYKNTNAMTCITEEYINKNKYRKEEKKEMLNSMLNSEAGLFEFIKVDKEEGQVYLKNVLNNNKYCMTDIGLSTNELIYDTYLYTRLITYDGITFGIGLNIMFNKKDPFIRKWIRENSEKYHKKTEIARFVEIYNEYESDDKGIKVKTRNV